MTESNDQSARSRLYTRTGDDGSTGLYSGTRVGKEHPRIEAYGTVDELNAVMGWVRSGVAALRTDARDGEATGIGPDHAAISMIDRILALLQERLFELGADLATPPGAKQEGRVSRIEERDVTDAESWIDEADGANEPLRTFVLPGGSELASRLHIARTVSRRAERTMVALGRNEPVGEAAIRFVNRVSDLLFALARRANLAQRVQDVPWTARPRSPATS